MLVAIQPVPTTTPVRSHGQDARLACTPGELVDVRVQQAQTAGSLVILIKGIPFHATSPAQPFKAGQLFQARVEQIEGQIFLRVQNAEGNSPPATPVATAATDTALVWLRKLLPAEEAFVASFDRLRASLYEKARAGTLHRQYLDQLEAFHAQILLQPEHLNGRRVKEALARLGLQYEYDLARSLLHGKPESRQSISATLKGWLLAYLSERDALRLSDGSTEADDLLRAVERTQVLNTFNMQGGQASVVPLPLREGPGWLYVERREDEATTVEQGEKPYRFSLVLEFDGLGPIRVDALLTGRHLTATLQMTGGEIHAFMTDKLTDLAHALTEKNYTVDRVATAQAPDEIVAGVDLHRRALPEYSLINLSV